jgi:hypothetical protein
MSAPAARKLLSNVILNCVKQRLNGASSCYSEQAGFFQGSQSGIGPSWVGTRGTEAYANVPTKPANSSNALRERFILLYLLPWDFLQPATHLSNASGVPKVISRSGCCRSRVLY